MSTIDIEALKAIEFIGDQDDVQEPAKAVEINSRFIWQAAGFRNETEVPLKSVTLTNSEAGVEPKTFEKGPGKFKSFLLIYYFSAVTDSVYRSATDGGPAFCLTSVLAGRAKMYYGQAILKEAEDPDNHEFLQYLFPKKGTVTISFEYE